MAMQPDNSSKKPNPFLNIFDKYSRFFVNPSDAGQAQAFSTGQTITIWQKLELEIQEDYNRRAGQKPAEAWVIRRVMPREPVDFMEYYRRKN